jgi:hypothetical protein
MFSHLSITTAKKLASDRSFIKAGQDVESNHLLLKASENSVKQVKSSAQLLEVSERPFRRLLKACKKDTKSA